MRRVWSNGLSSISWLGNLPILTVEVGSNYSPLTSDDNNATVHCLGHQVELMCCWVPAKSGHKCCDWRGLLTLSMLHLTLQTSHDSWGPVGSYQDATKKIIYVQHNCGKVFTQALIQTVSNSPHLNTSISFNI